MALYSWFSGTRINPQHIISAEYEGPESGMFADVRVDGDEMSLIAGNEGRYALEDNAGNKNVFEIRDIPAPVNVTGEWQIDFPAGWGAPDHIVIPELMSWTDSDQEGVKYFSGIASYHKKFDIPGENLGQEMIILSGPGQGQGSCRDLPEWGENGHPVETTLSNGYYPGCPGRGKFFNFRSCEYLVQPPDG